MMMNKRFLIFLMACILAAPPLAASADLIHRSLPPEHEFLSKNINECKLIGPSVGPLVRIFISDKNNALSTREEPGSKKEVTVIKRGKKFSITHTYRLNGEDWGIIGYLSRGWVPMSQISLVYDSISFDEEHKDEFYPYTGGLEEVFEAAEEIVIWEWPGSGIVRDFTIKKVDASILYEIFKITSAYTDEQRRIWGQIWPTQRVDEEDPLCLGWICISDPSNKDIPAFNPQRPVPWKPAGTTAPRSNFSIHLLTIILVTALTVGTAALIGAFWKPKKSAS